MLDGLSDRPPFKIKSGQTSRQRKGKYALSQGHLEEFTEWLSVPTEELIELCQVCQRARLNEAEQGALHRLLGRLAPVRGGHLGGELEALGALGEHLGQRVGKRVPPGVVVAPLVKLALLLQQRISLAVGSSPTRTHPNSTVETADVEHQGEVIQSWGQNAELLHPLFFVPVTSSTLLLQGQCVLDKA